MLSGEQGRAEYHYAIAHCAQQVKRTALMSYSAYTVYRDVTPSLKGGASVVEDTAGMKWEALEQHASQMLWIAHSQIADETSRRGLL